MFSHLLPNQTQHLEEWLELKMSGRYWEESDLRGNGHGRARFRKEGECTSGLASVTGSGQRSALLCKNLAGHVRSWCFPTGHLPPKIPDVPSKELLVWHGAPSGSVSVQRNRCCVVLPPWPRIAGTKKYFPCS